MPVEVEIDIEVLKSEIKKTYASVSQEPEKDFIFPTGRAWAEDLGDPAELAKVPETAVGSFAGVKPQVARSPRCQRAKARAHRPSDSLDEHVGSDRARLEGIGNR
jgi:hypothetical protein